MTAYTQWIRKVGLFITNRSAALQGPGGISDASGEALDLSAFRIKFSVHNADIESPNTCTVRVYNLSPSTVKQIRGEYSSLVLNAGYENGNYGVVFQGTIMQIKVGRENATDSFLDLYASDGDIGYNQGIVNASLARGTPADQIALKVANSMPGLGTDFGSLATQPGNFPSIRGTVLMGMGRARLRNIASSLDSGWSIQNGKVTFTPNTGYQDGEAVVINSTTGMIGMPEQTDGGVRVLCLLNSRIRIGGRVKLNNSEINQFENAKSNAAGISYNQWSGFQPIAPLNGDGMYRAFTVEHEGDNRGGPWYTQLTCLAVNETSAPNESVAPQ